MLVHMNSNQFFYKDKDREESLQTLGMMLELIEKCYVFGKYFFIDAFNSEEHPFLLKKGFDLMGIGMDPENVSNILERYIISGNYEGKELLERIIILEGIETIQKELFVSIFLEKVASYFGESYQKNFWDFANRKRKEIDGILLNDFYSEFCSSKPQIDSDVLLSRAFRSFSYDELRDLLKQVSLSDLAEALKNVREKLVIQVMDFLDRESSRWLMKELMRSDDSDSGFEKVKEAQLKILGIFASKKEIGHYF
ncbi:MULTISPECIES: hypothetical protein [Leptospira]|uniref:Flagellar motor switch protein FliG C-terminal domain-containing protein n=3 Tax=Leptospira weilii TaxID=28184 RepID=N1U3G4_9LEPT|nr:MULTISPECIES: hypothetical protein [Leptospira]EMM72339.1 hypothetical protein LEP1GSC038_3790 [Leptospira weilii str. 2006001855]EMY15033.1 hypothetical protein LEP1GSC043_1739 [Leptospira weilii str. Ecochallenge]EMJ65220.1 hypothetical protein LEP1GSC051_4087 [Leptospira sp. P2653]EMN46185.1 hypothetical protein LEP1GSC086_3268 [Leptospira weilii str. LNT 1234]EMN90221.1 hypothetical protein LEP1GSC108_4685 [Leptospira weilii str. UI 13098]